VRDCGEALSNQPPSEWSRASMRRFCWKSSRPSTRAGIEGSRPQGSVDLHAPLVRRSLGTSGMRSAHLGPRRVQDLAKPSMGYHAMH